MLARSKLNSIESKISEALINNEISHEDVVTIINEEKKYRELSKKSCWKNNLINKGKKIGINKVAKCNEIIINSLKPWITCLRDTSCKQRIKWNLIL